MENKEAIVNKMAPDEPMNYQCLSHDLGYTFVFINNSENYSLDEYITFSTLKNLKLTNGD